MKSALFIFIGLLLQSCATMQCDELKGDKQKTCIRNANNIMDQQKMKLPPPPPPPF